MVAVKKEPSQTNIHWATPEEGRALFDRQARQLVGMSGEGSSAAGTRASSAMSLTLPATGISSDLPR